MKKRIAALAVCLALALTACGQPKEAPATVGTIGTVDIPGGVYQLAQFSAYAEADSLTSEDNVLKAKLNVDGETVTGKAYIAAKTQEALERYAAVTTRFDELGGALTEDELTQAQTQTDNTWASYSDLYEQNGIDQASLLAYTQASYKASDLLEMLYGETGAEPVSNEQLTAFLAQNSAEGRGALLPMADTANGSFPGSDDIAQIKAAAEQLKTDVENGDTLEAAAAKALPGVLSLLGTTYTYGMLGQYVGSYTFLASDLDYYGDAVKSAILGTQPGQVTAVEMGLSMMVFQAGEKPTAQGLTANDRRAALAEMKGGELDAQLAQLGAQLPHSLDESAMKYYNPKNITTN